jgi:hypothetical protein
MKNLIIGASVASLLGCAASSAPRQTSGSNVKNVQNMTISGCVKEGTENGTYLLMDVAEVGRNGADKPVVNDTRGRSVVYWLDSTKGLKEEEGKRVQVTGTVDLNDIYEGETNVKTNSAKKMDSTTDVKVNSEVSKVTTETDTKPNVAPLENGTKTSVKETERVVHKLKVKNVKRIAGVCPA